MTGSAKTTDCYRFEFKPTVSLGDAEMSLHLAMYAAEGLYGPARVRLDGSYQLDYTRRSITVDASGEVGQTIVKIYTALLLREIGEDAFRVRPAPAGVVGAVAEANA